MDMDSMKKTPEDFLGVFLRLIPSLFWKNILVLSLALR